MFLDWSGEKYEGRKNIKIMATTNKSKWTFKNVLYIFNLNIWYPNFGAKQQILEFTRAYFEGWEIKCGTFIYWEDQRVILNDFWRSMTGSMSEFREGGLLQDFYVGCVDV